MSIINNKNNLLFVLIQAEAGGSERVALDIARHIDHSEYNVYASFFSAGTLLKEYKDVCEEVFVIPKKGGIDIHAMVQISNIIKDKRIDIVNAHHFMPFVYSILGSRVLNRRSLIYTEHTAEEVRQISRRFKYITNMLFFQTHAVVGISREMAQLLKKEYPSHIGRIACIQNGVDTERFQIEVNRDHKRAGLGLVPDHFVIGCVANFRKQKNHSCLIKAADLLKNSHPNMRLLLIGSSDHGIDCTEEEVRTLIKECGLSDKVLMLGYREDVPEILQCLDAFCLSSFYEGLPLSILEAMASKVPIVGSDVEGIREVIQHKKTGLLFAPNDHQALARALSKLIDEFELRENLKREGFNYVIGNHSMKSWVSSYDKLFKSVKNR